MVDKCPVHGHDMLLNAEYYRNPYALYDKLHEEGTVHRICLADEVPVWLVTRFADVHAGLRDQRLARAKEYAGPDFTTKRFPEGGPTGALPTSDPPEHTRLKQWVTHAFSPRKVRKYEPWVHGLVDEQLDRFAERGGGDLVDDYGAVIPITVISEILGIPHKFRVKLKTWADLMFGSDEETNLETLKELQSAMTEILKSKKEDPGDDLISEWMHTDFEEGKALTPWQMVSMATFTLLAGFDTTMSMISRGALALMEEPEVLAKLRANPDLYPRALEELLRMFGSVHHGFRRFAVEDVEIAGTRIAKGDTVLLHLAAAGRDPSRHEQPNVLDLDRPNQAHLAFGGGPHYCSGAELGRMETVIALEKLFTRFPDIALAVPRDELRFRHSPLVPALLSLPVTV